jgi:outer membrane protein, heavy metal efflux system
MRNTFSKNVRAIAGALILLALGLPLPALSQQASNQPIALKIAEPSVSKYLDSVQGMTADELVEFAFKNNAELAAMRSEVAAAEALVRQAGLRPNPSLETSGTRQIGGSDNSLMIQGSLPLELGGRRQARVRVAERELEIRKLAVAERERQLAAEVRAKFGESLAAVFKLRFTEEVLAVSTENFNLVAARVDEGRRPPLERNMETVELNRVRAMREMSVGSIEIKLLELRNLVGMQPTHPLRLSGDFKDLLSKPAAQNESIETALRLRPDLLGARALEQLAAARIEQARSEGKLDADVMVGYQRMKSGFPLSGIDDAGALRPIDSVFNFFTFGVTLNLPVRNRNQGMIAAAVAEAEAASRRREYGELTVRREVAAAHARYDSAARAMQIYSVGVREQAAANLSVVRQTYELGSKSLLDYIAEHHRFIETESGFIDAELETYLARIEILRATNAPELR